MIEAVSGASKPRTTLEKASETTEEKVKKSSGEVFQALLDVEMERLKNLQNLDITCPVCRQKTVIRWSEPVFCTSQVARGYKCQNCGCTFRDAKKIDESVMHHFQMNRR